MSEHIFNSEVVQIELWLNSQLRQIITRFSCLERRYLNFAVGFMLMQSNLNLWWCLRFGKDREDGLQTEVLHFQGQQFSFLTTVNYSPGKWFHQALHYLINYHFNKLLLYYQSISFRDCPLSRQHLFTVEYLLSFRTPDTLNIFWGKVIQRNFLFQSWMCLSVSARLP